MFKRIKSGDNEILVAQKAFSITTLKEINTLLNNLQASTLYKFTTRLKIAFKHNFSTTEFDLNKLDSFFAR